MTATAPAGPASAAEPPAGGIGGLLAAAGDTALAALRKADPAAAAEVDTLRRQALTTPAIVVVGESKRGKSSLVNALLGVPDLAPAGVGATTGAYLEFRHAPTPAARAWLPGQAEPVALSVADLGDWAVAGGRLPDGQRPPRRIEVGHPAPLLRHLTLVDTPGATGWDPTHTELALDAAAGAAALLFVVDAATPLTRPELDFLIEAGKRVDTVVFALAQIDAYPGWRRIRDDDQALVRAHAPRFGSAPWFPVSARLAHLAAQTPAEVAGELAAESGVAPLRHALLALAGRGHLLRQANVLRAVRSELVRLDLAVGERLRATEPDPAHEARLRADRAALAARRRGESRQWSLALGAEIQRARVAVTGRLRGHLTQTQEELLQVVDTARGGGLRDLPHRVDQALQALSVRLTHDLRARFDQIGEQVLAQVFTPDELRAVLGRLNATLRHALAGRPRREGAGPDNLMIAVSAGGVAFMAGRGAIAGASALGVGALVGGGLLIPVAGLGLGLAAGGFVLYRRRVLGDRQQARIWLREVLGEARAALSDEIAHRFTDLQHALTLALDDAIERRLRQLDTHLADLDRAAAADRADRAARRGALQAERDRLRTRIKQVDEVLARARALTTPTAPADRLPAPSGSAPGPGSGPAAANPPPGGTTGAHHRPEGSR